MKRFKYEQWKTSYIKDANGKEKSVKYDDAVDEVDENGNKKKKKKKESHLLESSQFQEFEDSIKIIVHKYFSHLEEYDRKEALLDNISRYIPNSI